MRALMIFATALSLGACATAPVSQESAQSVHPFVGCWDSVDGLSREGWTIDPSGWLVGYSANRNEAGEVTFYEAMRVERKPDTPDVLVVTGMAGGMTRFTRDMERTDVHRFVNAAHDFPQVITYRPSPGRLDAEISALDGSNQVSFLKATCTTP